MPSPHDAYFASLQQALTEAGIAWPSVVVDHERLQRNLARLKTMLAPDMRLRLVEKSLPVPQLLETVMHEADTHALMVFDGKQLLQVTRRFPDCDVLMGKPLPVAAARDVFQRLGDTAFAPARQLQWLIDTPTRLDQYAALAKAQDVGMRINVEVDVGLHRGGVPTPRDLRALLERMRDNYPHLTFAGLMGYDAHVGKIPSLVEKPATSFGKATAAYRAFQAVAREVLPELAETACWNGAGSPTIPMHGHDSPLNEVSAGSVLLKPLAFDTQPLADFEPATFIATPVLKAFDGTRLPGPKWLSTLLYAGRRRRARSWFVHGGGWPAAPASPRGLVDNKEFGLSFNQAIVNGPRDCPLAVDDLVFLRPYQSEGTLLHFGPVQVVAGGRVVDTWTPFGVS